MADNAWAQAQNLQQQLEGKQPLVQLEKLGALTVEDADEVRNIVAEGIADRFNQRYRPFPTEREGVEIRRNMVPKACVLKKRFEAHHKAIVENRQPPPIVIAKSQVSKPPAQPWVTQDLRSPSTIVQGAGNKQLPLVLREILRAASAAAPGAWGPASSSLSSSKRTSSSTEKNPGQPGRATTTPRKLHKNWENGLTPTSAKAWDKILANPSAHLSTLPGSRGNPYSSSSSSSKARGIAATTDNNNNNNNNKEEEPVTRAGPDAAGDKDITSAVGAATEAATGGGGMIDEVVGGAAAATPAAARSADVKPPGDDGDNDDGGEVAVKTSQGQEKSPTNPPIDFGDDLIWLGD